MEKKVKVTFELYDSPDWTMHVPAKNQMTAVAYACKHFVNEGLSLDDITNVKVEKSNSYL